MPTRRHTQRIERGALSSAPPPPTAAAHTATTGNKLPLPDDFFRPPPLTAKETTFLVGLAKRTCKEVVYYSRQQGGPVNWVHLSSEDGVDVYQGIDEAVTDTRAITYLRGATRIHATIDEIADFFRLDTPSKLSGFTQTVGKDLLDQKTLYDLARPTPDNPRHYVGVKWTAVESPSKLARNRDFCYLECHDEFFDTNSKKRGWVRSLHSIRLPLCPSLHKSHGLVRGSLYRSGFVFIESEDRAYVEAIHTLHMDIKGNAPNWLKILVMKRRIKNIAEVNRYFQLRRLCDGPLLGDLDLPSKSGIARCQVCEAKFGLFTRKSACRKCGKVICSTCSEHFILDYANKGAKKVRICSDCSEYVTGIGTDAGLEDRQVSHVHALRCEVGAHPIYDSPSSASATASFKLRQRSCVEQEYYAKNEDDRGLADILEAKRMHEEFEEHFSRSGQRREPIVLDQKASTAAAAAAAASPPQYASDRLESARGVFSHQHPKLSKKQQLPPHLNEHIDDDELGVPRGSRRQHLKHQRPQQQPQKRSAYQEFIQQERTRQSRVAQSLMPAEMHYIPKARHHAATFHPFVHDHSMDGDQYGENRFPEGQGASAFNSWQPPLMGTPAPEVPPEKLLESIRISSDWDEAYAVQPAHWQRRLENVSTLSDDTIGAPIRRSDLSMDPPSSRGQQSSSGRVNIREDYDESVGHHDHVATLPTSTHTMVSAVQGHSARPQSYDFQEFRRSYFDARNSDIADLEQRLRHQPLTDDEGDFRHGFSGSASESDFTDREYEIPPSSSNTYAGTVDQPHPGRQKEPRTAEELATVMALSAMRLYEKENGIDMRVSEETRQAALKKMVEIYTNEIERKSSENSLNSHPSERHGRRGSASIQALRTASSLPESGHDRCSTSSQSLGTSHSGSINDDLKNVTEVRDLSDLSASAFKAYSKEALKDCHPHANEGNHSTGATPRSPSISYSRRTTQLADDSRSRAAGTTHGSLPDSERAKSPSRSNAVRDDVSDTFSEKELINLPHLMRADDVGQLHRANQGDRMIRDSQVTAFSDVSNWQEGEHFNRHTNETSYRDQLGGRRLSETHPGEHKFGVSSQRISDQLEATSSRQSPQLRPPWGTGNSPNSVKPGELAPLEPLHLDEAKPRARLSQDELQWKNPLIDVAPRPPTPDKRSSCELDNAEYVTDQDQSELTHRSKMTLSELERYRASLAELMAEYNEERRRDETGGTSRQPEGEPDQHTRQSAYKSNRAPAAPTADLEHVLQELYL